MCVFMPVAAKVLNLGIHTELACELASEVDSEVDSKLHLDSRLGVDVVQ